MHIVFCTASLNAGGAERVLSFLANEFSERDFSVSVISLDKANAIPFYPLNKKIRIVGLDQLKTSQNGFQRIRNLVGRVFCMREQLKSLKPDVVIAFVDAMNILVLLASLGLKLPVIVCERTNPYVHKLSQLQAFLRRSLYPKARKIVVQTPFAARFFSEKQPVVIIPNPVFAPQKIKQILEPSCKHILSVGRLCKSKGFDVLIRAFASLCDTHTELSLVIYGEGEERANLEFLIETLKIKTRVTLPGVAKDIYEKLLAADLFVFPSSYEGFPNALCEAMAVGLPVISSNFSGCETLIKDGENGRLFPVGNVIELQKILMELINNFDERKKISEHAKKLPQKFDNQDIFSQWQNLVMEVLK